MKILKNNLTKAVIFILAGLVLGWLIFGDSSVDNEFQNVQGEHNYVQGTIWTCSMHPHITKNKAGTCPICGMDLIPLEVDATDMDNEIDYTVKFSNAAMKTAEITVSPVMKSNAEKEIYLSGKVVVDERKVKELSAHFSGRVEDLYVNYTGQKVRKGQLLASIYSKELVTAQRELLEAAKFKSTNFKFYQAVKHKFKNWMIPESEVVAIEQAGKVKTNFNIYSDISGIITSRNIEQGGYIMEGMEMFEITDLSKVWVVFEAYENDLPWIKLNDKIRFTISSIPDQSFESIVSFIDPILDAQKRTVSIRTEVNNIDALLKPEMLVSGRLTSKLSDIDLMIPKTAILWTGKTSVVYVKIKDRQNLFQYREITLGEDAGKYYIVKEGLSEGEYVVTNGVFKVDADAQLRGNQSMMNPSGGKVSMAGNGNMKINNDAMVGEISLKFKSQIRALFRSYLTFKNAMVSSDAVKTSLNVNSFQTALKYVDMKLVKGDAHLKWMDYFTIMKNESDKIQQSKNIEIQRASLFPLSEALYESIKYFKVDGINAYYQFCPMANEDKGAGWLSITEAIRNPYFGDAMLSCGETKEVLK